MGDLKSDFWKKYRRNYFRGYLFMFLTLATPFTLGKIVRALYPSDVLYYFVSALAVLFFFLICEGFL